MYKYQFSIGFNHKDTLKPVCRDLEGCKLIRNIAADYFGGCTVYPAAGAYVMNSGIQVVEESCVCIVYGQYSDDTIKQFATALKDLLYQESIAMEKTVCNTEFI